MNQTNPTVVILAGGQGKRFQPLTTPKCLIPIFNQPLISHLINGLKKANLKKIILVINPQQKKDYQFLKKSVDFAFQKKPLGMGNALLSAENKIKTDSIIVLNAGDFLDPAVFKDFLKTIQKTNPQILLTGYRTQSYFNGGYFKLKNNQIVKLIEKPGQKNQPSPFLNIVLHYFKNASQFFQSLKNSQTSKDDLYEVALSKMLIKNPAELFIFKAAFIPIKQPHHLLKLTDYFLKNYKKSQNQIHPTAKILKGAIIKNSYIGPHVLIGNHCLIRDSVIEQNCQIGFQTEIARSYIGPQSFFHTNFVGDSVIEGSVNLGSGARLANFRFDAQNIKIKKTKPQKDYLTSNVKFGAVLAKGVKLGINASIMPGITIGQNSIVSAGIVLNHALKDNQKAYLNPQTLITKKNK